MSDIAVQVGVGLAVAAILGAFAFSRRRTARLWRRAVQVEVQPIVGDEWSLAFPGELPEAAREIEGGEHGGREVYDWLRLFGAIDVRETRLRISVRGQSEDVVVIRNIRAEVEHRQPYFGTYVHSRTAGANVATLLLFDLDEETPTAWEWREDGARARVGSRPFFELNNVTLSRGEVHDFVIVGSANRYLCRWRLYLDFETGERRKTVLVGDPDTPFMTSGVPAEGFATRLDWAWYDGRQFLPPRSTD